MAVNTKSLLSATVVVLCLAASASGAAGRQSNRPNSSPPDQQSADPRLRTFSGTVWQNDGKFVLRDEAHRLWYQLDDQRWAARFEGKQVRVTGTLDRPGHAIHVQNIEEDPIESK